MLLAVIASFVLAAISLYPVIACTSPKVEVVPFPGRNKVEPVVPLPADIGLIKTEKTIVDKSCQVVNDKVKCDPKKKPTIRKGIN